jgi:hypothetical protein
VSGSIPGATDAPARSINAMQLRLLDTYQTGLRLAVQDAVQGESQGGWACLERLSTYLAGWFSRPDWFGLWALMTTTQSSALDRPDVAKATTETREEERRLLDRLAEATGAADPVALGNRMRAIIYGSATAAALDDGSAAADTLHTLLAMTWRNTGTAPLSSS